MGAALRTVGLEAERRYRVEDWFLGLDARRRGLGGANVVVSTSGNGGYHFLRWVRNQGLKVATDIVIDPRVYEVMAEERLRWPGWGPKRNLERAADLYRRHMEATLSVSDLLLCPSESVVEGLSGVRGFDPSRVAHVPYGLGHVIPRLGRPIAKRILFVGEAGLRKGIPYLAEAASMLRARDPRFEVRVAGTASNTVRARPECRDLAFLGHLGRQQIEEEFLSADVFCLPSLAEGMASVTLEAMAHGLPSVVTRSSGSPVRQNVEGLIVPERSAAALAEALSSVTEDRTLRTRMSAAAHAKVAQHTFDAIGDKLVATLRSLIETSAG